MDKNIVDGPTGETCLDLPSPYQAHPTADYCIFTKISSKN